MDENRMIFDRGGPHPHLSHRNDSEQRVQIRQFRNRSGPRERHLVALRRKRHDRREDESEDFALDLRELKRNTVRDDVLMLIPRRRGQPDHPRHGAKSVLLGIPYDRIEFLRFQNESLGRKRRRSPHISQIGPHTKKRGFHPVFSYCKKRNTIIRFP